MTELFIHHLFIVDGTVAFTNRFPRLSPPLKHIIGVIRDFPIIWLLFRMVFIVYISYCLNVYLSNCQLTFAMGMTGLFIHH